MMSGNGKYKGSLLIALVHVIVYGILAGFILGIVAFCKWQTGFVLGLIVGAGATFFLRTTVEIKGESICIRSIGCRDCFDLPQFAYPSIRRNTYTGSYSKFTSVKCYLVFRTSEGYKRCRLHGFGERDLEKVLEAIRSAHAEYMTEEEKADVLKEYNDEASEALIYGRESDNEFNLSADVLMKKEKECVRKISLIAVGVVVAAAVMDGVEIFLNHTFSIQLLFLTMLALMLLILVIVTYVGLGMKRRICAERIIVDSDHMIVRGQYYSYSGIERIKLTSPRKRSDSVFPVQHYMYISAGGTTTKYWLGSEASFGFYAGLCRTLEQGMILYPNKLKFIK